MKNSEDIKPSPCSPGSAPNDQTDTTGLTMYSELCPSDRQVLSHLTSPRDSDARFPAITGTDLASFVLSPSHGRLSKADLNRVGLQLLKEAAAAGEYRAASSVFGSLVTVNKPMGPDKLTANETVANALRKAAKAFTPKPKTIDVAEET